VAKHPEEHTGYYEKGDCHEVNGHCKVESVVIGVVNWSFIEN